MTVDAKIAAFEALVAEVSTAVAELVEAAQKKKASADEIATTLAEMLEVMRAKPDPVEATAAIQQIRQEAPVVNVENKIEVAPTPIEFKPQINVTVPGSDYEIQHHYSLNGRIEKSSVKRIGK